MMTALEPFAGRRTGAEQELEASTKSGSAGRGDLVKREGRATQGGERVRTTPVAWYGHNGLTRQEWTAYGSKLGVVTKGSNWWLGDWVRFGQRHYNDHRFEIASRITGYDEQTLRNFAYVAGRCDFSRRRENLSWSHHAEVAALEPGEQEQLLDEAVSRKLSVRRLRDAVRVYKRVELGPDAPVTNPASTLVVAPDGSLSVECPRCGDRIQVPQRQASGA
jgi:hypothetical protein